MGNSTMLNLWQDDGTALSPKNNRAVTIAGLTTLATPFTLGTVSVTATGTQLNYLNGATGTTGTTTTNLVFSTSPTLVTPVLGTATGTALDLTVAAAGNDIPLVVTQNDTTNNPVAVSITNTGTGDSLQIDTTDFVVKADGTVGIGTSPVLANLHIDDADTITQFRIGGSTSPMFMFNNETSYVFEISYGRDGTAGTFPNTSIASSSIALYGSNLDSYIAFKTTNANNVNATERMRIIKTGNVGIGIEAPTSLLHVLSTDAQNYVTAIFDQQDTSTANGVNIINAGTGNGLFIDQNGNGVALNIDNDGTNTSFLVQGTTANDFIILKNGNIGIGTATPLFNLDVNGNIVANSLGLYDPRNNPLQYPAETVITNLQSGHGFVAGGTGGSQTDDTTDFIKGSQSLELVTNGAGAAKFTTNTSFSPIDLTGKYLKVWIKVDNTDNVAEYWFYAASDAALSNRYTWKIEDDISQMTRDATSAVWVPITLSFSEATITGSPDRSAITAIRWRVTDKNSTAITANWGGMSSLPEPSKGIVSITFDDAWLSQYDEARKKMDEYGFAGTAYVTLDNIGTANYMTLQNLKDLQDKAGWDISAHHQTDFTTLTATQVEEAILDIKNYLLKNGFSKGANDFAYPNGAYDETTVLPLIKKYFRSARTIADYRETYPPADYHKLRVLLVVNTTTTSSIATAIDNARVNKEWLILVFHKIVTTPTVSTEYSIANFGTVIDDINSDGILVRTVSDVLDHGEESIAFTAKANSLDIGNKNFLTLGNVGIGEVAPSAKLDIVATDAENLTGLEINQQDTGTSLAATIINAGTGNGLFIDQNANGLALNIDKDCTVNDTRTWAAAIASDNAGTGTALGCGIDMSSFAVDEPLFKVVADAGNTPGTLTGQIAIDVAGTTYYVYYYTTSTVV